MNDLLVSREVGKDGEKYCSDELHNAGRGSFESGNSGASAGSLKGVVRRKSVGRHGGRNKTIVENKGHKMRKILVSPDMSVFF